MSTCKLIGDCLGEAGILLKELGIGKLKTSENNNKVTKNITNMDLEYYEVDKRMHDNGEEYYQLYQVLDGGKSGYRLTVLDYVRYTTYEKIDNGNVWKPVTSEIKHEHVKYRNMKEVKKSLMQHKKGRIKYRGKVITHLVEIFHNGIQPFSVAWIIVGLDKRFWSAEEAIEYIDNEMSPRNEGTYVETVRV